MTAPHMVPKVHPLDRDLEADDPMELVATPVEGDPELMLECLIQEFAGLGAGPDDLMRMFLDTEYPVLNQLIDFYGPQEIRRRVDGAMSGLDAFSVQVTIDETPDPNDDDELELFELMVRNRD